MLGFTVDEIDITASALASDSPPWSSATVVSGESTVGGGSAPGAVLSTRLVAVTDAALSATKLEAQLRMATDTVVARIENDRVLIDLRTVDNADDDACGLAFASVMPSPDPEARPRIPIFS